MRNLLFPVIVFGPILVLSIYFFVVFIILPGDLFWRSIAVFVLLFSFFLAIICRPLGIHIPIKRARRTFVWLVLSFLMFPPVFIFFLGLGGVSMAVADGTISRSGLWLQSGLISLGVSQLLIFPWYVVTGFFAERIDPQFLGSGEGD